jgi:predicted PurR-regulated permease PerM
VNYLSPNEDVRRALIIDDPLPIDDVHSVWASAGQAAIIGIFLILFGAVLYFGRAILLPILTAAVLATTLAPAVKAGKRRGVQPWVTGLGIVCLLLLVLGVIITALAAPVSSWIGRAPEIGAAIKEKFSVLDQPLAMLRSIETSVFGTSNLITPSPPGPEVVLPIVSFVTPAAAELLLFFGALLFFLVGQIEIREKLVGLFSQRDTRLRFLKIMRDIERNLARYLGTVTVINAALGAIVALGAWLIGIPNPVLFGLLAAVLNYIPYIGPAIMVAVLFAAGLVSFPSLTHACVAPVGMMMLTTTEGHFITPTIIGRRLTLSPLLVFLGLAFWTWMWGPIGAFLAAPLLIIGLVVSHHLLPSSDVTLPD